MSFPVINQKKNPVGRQSTKKNDKSNSNLGISSLIATAEIVIEVYRLKNTAENKDKTIKQIMDSLNNKYKIKQEMNIEQQVEDITLPSEVNKIDSDNNINGTLCVRRYVYHKLGLIYKNKKYTQ
jgi:hypothetical protein